ncbi:hypothetical protein B0H63DRAFT_498621 [Podospora didyma]|uniref:NAD(P)-binding domain-containing protein n=1 Tax=Podospora didyma TaxID=330526 RepID=A0AAE0U740_9PEZI|nr:hypothetical protein B0H63DRAFT_498621 [Podospora didyma]
MKVLITGATGLVGGGLVRECVANEKITHVFILTRKPLLAFEDSPKVTVILHDDFSTYPPDLLHRLAGVQAVLWAIGGRSSAFPDLETYKRVQVDYLLAAADAFLKHLAPQIPAGTEFRFVFCSGKYAEWDEKKPLCFMTDTRRMKGEAEQGLCEIDDTRGDEAGENRHFTVNIVRPSGVLPAGAGLAQKLVGKLYGAIDVDHLARAMVRIALDGHEERIIENDVLLAL